MTTVLCINDTFEALDVPYRLLHVVEALGLAYVIRLDLPTAFPEAMKIAELQSCADSPDLLRVIADPTKDSRPSEISVKDIGVRDARYDAIKPVVEQMKRDPEIWNRENLRRCLRTHAAAIDMSEKSLLTYMRLWWIGGQTTEALLGNHWKSGRVSGATEGSLVVSETTPNGVLTVVFAPGNGLARGRDPEGKYGKLSMNAELRKLVYDKATEHYLADGCKTVHGATIAVLDDLFSLKDTQGVPLRDEAGAAVLKPLGQRPTFDQIRYLLRKALPASKAFIDRNSPAEYLNNHAPSTGSVLDDCLGPGDIFEIDSTKIDMWVVARINRAVIIGKATYYLIIDRWSRLIVGLYLTLDPPSWASARQAILSTGQDWQALCERLGVVYKSTDWPARGVLPNRFFSDRGDMASYASDLICDGLTVQVTNAPALLSSDKPIVESGFLTTHVPLRQEAPGYEPPQNAFKRRAKKYHKDACMTLDELAADLLRIVIAHNRTEKLGYQVSAEEILGNESVAPIKIWDRLVTGRMGLLTRMPLDLMRRRLLQQGFATVRVDGIHFHSEVNSKGESVGLVYENLVYKHPDRKHGEWHARASIVKGFQVKVLFNPSVVNQITIQDPNDDTLQHDVVLTSSCEDLINLSFAEAGFISEAGKRKKRAAAKSNEGHNVARRQDMRAAAAKSKAEAADASRGLTPGMRLSGGDLVREDEARTRRAANNDLNAEAMQYLPIGADSDRLAARTANEQPDGPASTPPPAVESAATAAPMPSTSGTDPSLLDELSQMIDMQ